MSADRPSSPAGLTQAEADARLAREGYNELPAAKPRGLLVIVLEVIREPMFLLLVAASTIYLVFGDVREAIVLLASILVVMGITIYQSRKTESALEALRDLSSPRALVLRDGSAETDCRPRSRARRRHDAERRRPRPGGCPACLLRTICARTNRC